MNPYPKTLPVTTVRYRNDIGPCVTPHTLVPRSDAPPLNDVGGTEGQTITESDRVGYHGSFMIVFRKAWNWLADFIGFVKKSAMLSAVRTKGTSISKDSTMSRMKK